jgi:hypothetical protein
MLPNKTAISSRQITLFNSTASEKTESDVGWPGNDLKIAGIDCSQNFSTSLN